MPGMRSGVVPSFKRARRSEAGLALLEADIAKTCSDLLMWDGWRMLITDPVRDSTRGKGFGEIGMSDRLYIRYNFSGVGFWNMKLKGVLDAEVFHRAKAEVMWIEWKRIRHGRKKATKATPEQVDWHRAERARGALTFISGVDFPATIDGFIAWYKLSGLQHKVPTVR